MHDYYYSTSEFVTSGHPDRVADNIAAYIINAIQFKDKANSHAAIEVFLTHDTVIISGEAKTTLKLNKKFLKEAVKAAYKASGYIPQARKFWTKNELCLPEDLKIVNKISAQSPDIAMATTNRFQNSGWNDQGVFFSSAENSNKYRLGTAMAIATRLGEFLQSLSIQSILDASENIEPVEKAFGPDIKVLVTVKTQSDGFTPIEITGITLAVPHTSKADISEFRHYIINLCREFFVNHNDFGKNGKPLPLAKDCRWVVNGTGRFVVHGNISDSSMTGRKISVNHPSAGPVWCNKMIGGGSLVKPFHASDFLLNVASRFIANVLVQSGLTKYAIVGCSSAIGQHGLVSLFIQGDSFYQAKKNAELRHLVNDFFTKEQVYLWSVKGLTDLFDILDVNFDFLYCVNNNFFGKPSVHPWENLELINSKVGQLNRYLEAHKEQANG